MTTYFDFVPSSVAAPQFQPTLDGQQYTCIVTWNIYAQRYYLNCYDLSGNLIFCRAVAGSATGLDIQSLTWSLGGSVSLITAVPHGYSPGATVDLTVSGCAPDGFNGLQRCYAEDPSTLSFPLTINPGTVSTLGTISKDVSLSAGYFNSTIVFRTANMQFEINP